MIESDVESYFLRKDGAMVNFMCQFYKAIWYPYIWSNIILAVYLRVFGVRLTLELVD